MLARCGYTRPDGRTWCCQLAAPSTFGLSEAEIWAEAQRLFETGWSVEEIRATLELPEAVS
jgi:hypothetical protein